MKITEHKIKVSELCQNYRDDGDGGVYGYDDGNHKLTIRPSFQREFIYKDNQRNAVIDSVMKERPLNVMYWSKVSETEFEVMDGQQRTISLGQYLNSDFSIKIDGNSRFYHNLSEEEQQQINDYLLTVYICEGSESEKLEWFKVINIAGEVLTDQELLNATYTGPWLADAKNYFSKRNCVAGQMANGFIKGNPIRQEYLEKALDWIADRDGLESGAMYMAIHQHDDDANELWLYFQEVISWAKRLFPNTNKKLTECQPWGLLYNKYKDKSYNSNSLELEIKQLLLDDDVTKQSGIIPYLLSDREKKDERLLSLRAFTESQKLKAYEAQNHKCAICGKEFEFEEMEGDHIVPWSKGGHTVQENCQMLCKDCNGMKTDS